MKVGEIRDEIILAKETSLLAKSTIMSYKNVLKHLEEFFGKDKNVEEITLKDFKDYIVNRKSWKRSSLTRHIVYVKSIFKYLKDHGFINSNIMSRIQTPRGEETPVDFLTNEELDKLDKASMTPVIDQRRRAIYWIIRDTGLRASEVGNIMLKDLDLNDNFIYIRRSKAKITKTVPISDHTKRVIKEYLLGSPPTTIYLFGMKGGLPLGRDTVSHLMDDIFDKAFDLRKWHKKRGAHLFRHACASQWVENNGNLKGLQFIMGWRSLKMCDRYVHASPAVIKKMFNDMNNNKKKNKENASKEKAQV
jgi:site-specific recombinase XerD